MRVIALLIVVVVAPVHEGCLIHLLHVRSVNLLFGERLAKHVEAARTLRAPRRLGIAAAARRRTDPSGGLARLAPGLVCLGLLRRGAKGFGAAPVIREVLAQFGLLALALLVGRCHASQLRPRPVLISVLIVLRPRPVLIRVLIVLLPVCDGRIISGQAGRRGALPGAIPHVRTALFSRLGHDDIVGGHKRTLTCGRRGQTGAGLRARPRGRGGTRARSGARADWGSSLGWHQLD